MHSVLFEIPGFSLGGHQIGPFPIHAYGTMLALAFMVSFIGLWKLTKRTKLMPPDYSVDIVLAILLSGVIGARALYVALNWGTHYAEDPKSMFYIWKGGLAFHGGVIGAILAALVCVRRMRISFGALADHLAPLLAVSYAITKIGCFLNGCCHGHPAEGLPWACVFPVEPGDLNHLTPPSHPAQIYDCLLNLAVAGILWWHFSRRRWNGHTFVWWVILYSITRIITDSFRYYGPMPQYSTADPMPGMSGLPIVDVVTQAQFGSAVAILASLAVLIACRRCSFRDRVDLRVAPAFFLGTIPGMGFLFVWLALRSEDGPSSGMVVGALVYLGLVLAGAVGYPLAARRVPFREDEAVRGTPCGFGEYWDSEAEERAYEERREAEAEDADAADDAPATEDAAGEPDAAAGDDDGLDRPQ